MALTGSLAEVALPDVLQLLSMGQKTGRLAVADGTNRGYVFFDRGDITYATIVNRRDRLGDILVKNGLVTAEQLQVAVERQSREQIRRLGELLVELGALSRPDLERYMRLQIEEAVYFLFTWSSGTFTFESGMRPEAQDFLVRLGPESLLLEGARRVDEWSVIEKKIPSFDLIFTVERAWLGASLVTLTPEQERILPLLDGERDVAGVVEESGLLEFEVGKALYGLVAAGFAHRVGRSKPSGVIADAGPEAAPAARSPGGSLEKTGMSDDADRGRRRRRRAPQGKGRVAMSQGEGLVGGLRARREQISAALAAAKGGAELDACKREIIELFKQVDATIGELTALRDDIRTLVERYKQLAAETKPALAPEFGGEKAPVHADHIGASTFIEKGWSLLSLGDYDGSIQALGRALELSAGDLQAESLLGWAQMLKEDYDDALATFQRVLMREPSNSLARINVGYICLKKRTFTEAIEHLSKAIRLANDKKATLYAHFYLGLVYFERQMYEDAESFFRKTLELGPNLIEAYFELGRTQWFAGDPAAARESWEAGFAANKFSPWGKRCREMLLAVEAGGAPTPPGQPAA
ncbi:MAG: DUF4388 domain-containing protein [Gemmatimonadetes bacterium]|nr:DUF4388 domain-containing protein [Gemmatimonadota bacterium]